LSDRSVEEEQEEQEQEGGEDFMRNSEV